MTTPKKVFLFLMLATLTAACGGAGEVEDGEARAETGSPPATRSGTALIDDIDGCSLVTAEEVASILGQPAEGKEDEMTGFDATCTWSVDAGDGATRDLSLEIGQLDAFMDEEYASFKENMDFQRDVDGIGDAAFLAGGILGGSILVTREGPVLLFLSAQVPDQEATLQSLAPKVLDRIDDLR